MGIANHRALRGVGMATCLVFVLVVGLACSPAGESSNWMMNGFLDPSQVGQFRGEKRNEVRSVISILEEPMGIPNTEEPTPDDHVARFEETRIAPGDAVNITIFELMAAGQASETQVRVGNSGYETIPGIGRVRLLGFTPGELEMEIKRYLKEQDILADADVQVTLLDVRSLQYSILGSVQRPGTFVLPRPDYRLLQAVAEAGGISPLIEKVYVFRKGEPAPDEAGAVGTANPAPAGQLTYHLSDVGRSGGGLPFKQPTASGASEDQDVPTSSTSEPPPSTGGGLGLEPPPASDMPGLASETPTSTTTSAATLSPESMPTDQPAVSQAAVDEMEILEGRTGTSQPSISWDPARGGWVIEGAPVDQLPGAESPAGSQPTGQLPPTPPGIFAGGAEERTRIIEIPAKELMEGDGRYNIVVRPFDVIQVPPGAVGEYYIQGNVARPGAYGMNGRRPTLKEAIASAGGFGALAWPSRVDLIRRVSQDEEQIIQVNLDAIYAGEAPDLYLKPNDLVNVGSSPAAVFLAVLRNAFRFTYGFGFVYDRNFADADSFGAKESVKTRRLQEAQIRGLPSN
ncbi:Polysaccharide biosynthesis/export protein [Phycisphaerae bacterium RAS2]|nr:Polysaccharide biosynthesis/export protein [Phycisphaerae bacterium RAS2]